MQITFGKFSGKTSHVVALRHGAYAKWVLEESAPTGALKNLQNELKRHFDALDAKPHVGKCSQAGCSRPVKKLTAYAGVDDDLHAWCAHCDPYSLGAPDGKLVGIASMQDAMNHITYRCGGAATGYDRMLKAYAKAKGAPDRVTADTAVTFFR